MNHAKRSLFTVGFLGYSAGLLLIPVVSSPFGLLVPMAAFGFGHGLVVPNVQTFMTKLAPGQFRAATMSLYNIALRLGQTVGPVLFGIFYIYGFDRMFFVAGGIGALGFIILGLRLRPRLTAFRPGSQSG